MSDPSSASSNPPPAVSTTLFNTATDPVGSGWNRAVNSVSPFTSAGSTTLFNTATAPVASAWNSVVNSVSPFTSAVSPTVSPVAQTPFSFTPSQYINMAPTPANAPRAATAQDILDASRRTPGVPTVAQQMDARAAVGDGTMGYGFNPTQMPSYVRAGFMSEAAYTASREQSVAWRAMQIPSAYSEKYGEPVSEDTPFFASQLDQETPLSARLLEAETLSTPLAVPGTQVRRPEQRGRLSEPTPVLEEPSGAQTPIAEGGVSPPVSEETPTGVGEEQPTVMGTETIIDTLTDGLVGRRQRIQDSLISLRDRLSKAGEDDLASQTEFRRQILAQEKEERSLLGVERLFSRELEALPQDVRSEINDTYDFGVAVADRLLVRELGFDPGGDPTFVRYRDQLADTVAGAAEDSVTNQSTTSFRAAVSPTGVRSFAESYATEVETDTLVRYPSVNVESDENPLTQIDPQNAEEVSNLIKNYEDFIGELAPKLGENDPTVGAAREQLKLIQRYSSTTKVRADALTAIDQGLTFYEDDPTFSALLEDLPARAKRDLRTRVRGDQRVISAGQNLNRVLANPNASDAQIKEATKRLEDNNFVAAQEAIDENHLLKEGMFGNTYYKGWKPDLEKLATWSTLLLGLYQGTYGAERARRKNKEDQKDMMRFEQDLANEAMALRYGYQIAARSAAASDVTQPQASAITQIVESGGLGVGSAQ
jgi:hypothetical protein